MDEVEHSQNRTPHKATEIHFGLHYAGSGHLARRGRPGRESTYLRNAVREEHAALSAVS